MMSDRSACALGERPHAEDYQHGSQHVEQMYGRPLYAEPHPANRPCPHACDAGPDRAVHGIRSSALVKTIDVTVSPRRTRLLMPVDPPLTPLYNGERDDQPEERLSSAAVRTANPARDDCCARATLLRECNTGLSGTSVV